MNLRALQGLLKSSVHLTSLRYQTFSQIYRCIGSFTSKVHVRIPDSYAHASNLNSLEFKTIGQSLREQCQKSGTQTAIISVHESITKTFQQFDEEVDRLACTLADVLELQRGDVIALWSANCYNWLLIQYAAARKGLILTTLNPAYKSEELSYALQKSECKALFLPGHNSKQETVNQFAKVLNHVKFENIPHLKQIVFMDGELKSDHKHQLHHLEELMSKSPKSVKDDYVDPDDPALIMFTSGTTGKPKGAVLSHNILCNNAYLTGYRFTLTHSENAKICVPVPLYHIFGYVYGSIMMAKVGSTCVLPSYRYNISSMVEAINKEQCTHCLLVPTMTLDLVNAIESYDHKLPSLESIITGSSMTPVSVAKRAIAALPSLKSFLIRYGSTETGGCMTMPLQGEKPDQTIDNVGKVLDFTELKIVDPRTRQVVKLGEEGEVCVRGHNLMHGYWKDQEKTKEAITQTRYFKTGDVGKMDADGTLRLVGRIKEMILRGGENIHPAEIEEILHQHPSIKKAYVCSVPDARLGDEICAWIQLKDGLKSLPEDEIKSFCKERISFFKVPKYCILVEYFPQTLTGKPQRHVMRAESCRILGLKEAEV